MADTIATRNKTTMALKDREPATQADLDRARSLVEVSTADAAWLANMSYRRFRERMAKGQIPGTRRVGSRWHIAAKPFVAWLESPAPGEVIA